MKQIISFILFIIFSTIQIQAQSANDLIQISNVKADTAYNGSSEAIISQTVFANDSITICTAKGGDIKGYLHGDLLSSPDYKNLFKDNPEALHQIKTANFDYKFGLCLDYVGGFVFGFCLGSAISGQKLDASWGWTLGTSAAMAGLGIIIYNSGKNHHRKAIDIYNSSPGKSNQKETGELKIGFVNSGLKFAYRF
ncbi:MAG TPA: hypothetical protein VJ602_04140 [Paludibacter sp.]|nr:hypothetical protein [Paludibacter sp.]